VVIHSTAASDDEIAMMNYDHDEVDRRVPVTILTGFLGSGKTTLLNHLLQQQQHNMTLAIIENEFGEVGVDEHLLYNGKKIEVDQEPIIEVINGCICCTVRGDLIVALDRLYDRVQDFDGVIIETTGLADPAPVCQTFFLDEQTRDRYRLDAVITVVDSQYIMDRLAENKPHGVVNEAAAQVAFADKILLNKIDLVQGNDNGTAAAFDVLDRIETKLKSINPTATIQRTVNSVVAPADILQQRAFEMERVLEFDPDFLRDDDDDDTVDDHDHGHQHHDHQHDGTVSSVGIKLPGSVNYLMLERWLDRLVTVDGANLYRYKGLVSVQGVPNKYLFQGVGTTLTSGFANLPWQTDEPRESRFCFIGKNLDRELYVSGFTACRVDAVLRFAVGDTVEVNIGSYVRGTVLKQWDDGNAYRVEIEDEFGHIDNVWAPIDIDNYIRRPILKR
jgi:G3E family GTPase